MEKLKCFEGEIDFKKLDRTPFSFTHRLADHPALAIENIIKIIPDFPEEKVMFSKNLNNLNLNFDDEINSHKSELNQRMVLETLQTTNAYVAIRNLELHTSFKEIYENLIEDVGDLLKNNQTGTSPITPALWLFIASPGAVTPFHFDRWSNFIMQIRGSKELAIFPPGKEEIFSKKITESYIDWSGDLPPWNDEIEQYAIKYNFSGGEAVHIPFISGHYVKNGMEDISITLSFFFHSDETFRWSEAMRFNSRLSRLGISTNAVGNSLVVDKMKAGIFPAVDLIYNAARKLRT